MTTIVDCVLSLRSKFYKTALHVHGSVRTLTALLALEWARPQ